MAPRQSQPSRDRLLETPSDRHHPELSRKTLVRSVPRGRDLYDRITDQIIAAIETGAGAWRMPWHHNGTATSRPTNAVTGRRYRGINTVALWAAAEAADFATGLWATYAQWHSVGAQVQKG